MYAAKADPITYIVLIIAFCWQPILRLIWKNPFAHSTRPWMQSWIILISPALHIQVFGSSISCTIIRLYIGIRSLRIGQKPMALNFVTRVTVISGIKNTEEVWIMKEWARLTRAYIAVVLSSRQKVCAFAIFLKCEAGGAPRNDFFSSSIKIIIPVANYLYWIKINH